MLSLPVEHTCSGLGVPKEIAASSPNLEGGELIMTDEMFTPDVSCVLIVCHPLAT